MKELVVDVLLCYQKLPFFASPLDAVVPFETLLLFRCPIPHPHPFFVSMFMQPKAKPKPKLKPVELKPGLNVMKPAVTVKSSNGAIAPTTLTAESIKDKIKMVSSSISNGMENPLQDPPMMRVDILETCSLFWRVGL